MMRTVNYVYSNKSFRKLYIFIWLASVDTYNAQVNHQSASKYISFSKHLKQLVTTMPLQKSLHVHGTLVTKYTHWLRNHGITSARIDNTDEDAYSEILTSVINKYLSYCHHYKLR